MMTSTYSTALPPHRHVLWSSVRLPPTVPPSGAGQTSERCAGGRAHLISSGPWVRRRSRARIIASMRERVGGSGRGASRPRSTRAPVERAGSVAAPGTPAAVLIGLLAHPEGPSVILTQRSARLREHAAEISLPGGRIEAGDEGPSAAALREAFEEIGLAPDRVELLGRLSPLRDHLRLSRASLRGLDRTTGGVRPGLA